MTGHKASRSYKTHKKELGKLAATSGFLWIRSLSLSTQDLCWFLQPWRLQSPQTNRSSGCLYPASPRDLLLSCAMGRLQSKAFSYLFKFEYYHRKEYLLSEEGREGHWGNIPYCLHSILQDLLEPIQNLAWLYLCLIFCEREIQLEALHQIFKGFCRFNVHGWKDIDEITCIRQ